ncbi:MAG: hypothetical protein J2O49_02355 [Sciscionella sp.]|nr:hypothetical protein [Sciscionella sp.]
MTSTRDIETSATSGPAHRQRATAGAPNVAINSVYQRLDASVLAHIDHVTALAEHAGDTTAAELARAELPRLVGALRAVLDEHRPDARGRCRVCRGRSLFRRAVAAPCRAYLNAYLSLTIDTEPPSAHPATESARPATPVRVVATTNPTRLSSAC